MLTTAGIAFETATTDGSFVGSSCPKQAPAKIIVESVEASRNFIAVVVALRRCKRLAAQNIFAITDDTAICPAKPCPEK
jgi:hypothetical protein